MTDARVETTYPDRVAARELLTQAEIFLGDARKTANANESRAVLAHNTAISACDAILTLVGLRVSGGDRAHVLRLTRALAELAHDDDELADRLDASRVRRNEASYAAQPIATASVDDALDATAELVELVRVRVA